MSRLLEIKKDRETVKKQARIVFAIVAVVIIVGTVIVVVTSQSQPEKKDVSVQPVVEQAKVTTEKAEPAKIKEQEETTLAEAKTQPTATTTARAQSETIVEQEPARKEEQQQPAETVARELPESEFYYTVQVASYSLDRSDFAEQAAEELKAEGYPAYVTIIGNYNVVRAGKYTSREAADTAQIKLGKEDTLVLRVEEAYGKLYEIQVAFFNSYEYAKNLRDTLKTKGYPVYIVSVEGPQKKGYTVKLGVYQDEKRANAILDKLKIEGYEDAFKIAK